MEIRDYMKLSKKRLAELLAERDAMEQQCRVVKSLPIVTTPYEPPCFHGGVCTNPQMDCINCPRHGMQAVGSTKVWTETNTRGEKKQNNDE